MAIMGMNARTNHIRHGVALLAVMVPLAVAPAAAGAQPGGAGAGGRASRVPDSLAAQRAAEVRLVRVRAELDSLFERIADGGLNDSERRAMFARVTSLVASLESMAQVESDRAAVAGAMSRALSQTVRGRVGGGRSGRTLVQVSPSENGFVTMRFDQPVFKGWIGLNTLGSQRDSIANGEIFIRYIDSYPKIVSVDPSSPAASAGILKGDLLIAYDGSDVVERGFSVTKLLQPSKAVRITVDRDGDKRDYPVVVAMAPPHVMERRREFGILAPTEVRPSMAPRALREAEVATTMEPMPGMAPAARPRTFLFRAIGDPTILGARVEQLNEELSDIFGVSSGVVVLRVPDDAPARRSGLRGGDVIVKVDGAPVESVAELRRAVERASQRDRTLDLGIIRNHKPASITLQW